jgi:hypothetical protein
MASLKTAMRALSRSNFAAFYAFLLSFSLTFSVEVQATEMRDQNTIESYDDKDGLHSNLQNIGLLFSASINNYEEVASAAKSRAAWTKNNHLTSRKVAPGCTNPSACNYNPSATEDDGTCLIEGAACFSGNLCFINEIVDTNCNCVGTLRVCDDGNPCTTDTCDPNIGCISINNPAGTPCDDGNPCTINDVCDGNGNCLGTPIVCPDDGDPCTIQVCNPATGSCDVLPAPAGTPCDDGDPCTVNDVCDGNGNCAGMPIICDDGNPNTIGTCDENGNCVFSFLPAGTPCNDNNACTFNDVADGLGNCTGTPLDCDDGNPCTTDTCDPNIGCISINNPAGTPCDDGNPCTINDVCDGNGNCLGTPIVCPDDGDPCTIQVCNPATGSCDVLPAPAGTPCDDGDPCTVNDVCDGNGNCAGMPIICDDGNPNTIGTCDENGNCVFSFLPAGTPCNDNNACTFNDVADGLGNCTGTPLDCDDGNPCTTDTCDPNIGCISINNPAGTPCDDGNPCTINDVCDGNGNCLGTPIVCPDDGDPCTIQVCNPATGSCDVLPAPAGTPCDDGDPCTVNDVCDGNGNCAGMPIICDDGNPNTIGTCDENGNCVFSFLPAGTPCNDNNACTFNDVADGLGNCTGTPLDCDDGNPCTTDTCEPAVGCIFIAIPDSDGDGLCDAVDGCPNIFGDIGDPCDDGDPLTINDIIMLNCGCAGTIVSGCTYPEACNYDPAALQDDGSCEYLSCEVLGCTSTYACNFNPLATLEDGSCEYTSCAGCTYIDATNYEPSKTIDDGSCSFDLASPCPTDFNDDGAVNSSDLLFFLGDFGESCFP